jgi:predicted dehydrogenase
LDDAFGELGNLRAVGSVIVLRTDVLIALDRSEEGLRALTEIAEAALASGDAQDARRLGGELARRLDNLGRPDEALTFGTLSPAGADDTVHLQWLYDGVPKAQLWCSASTAAPNQAAVYGTGGWIRFDSPMFRPTGLTVHSGEDEYRIEDPIAGIGPGYGPEVEEVERCLRAGLSQSPLVPQDETIAILELLDEARAVLGVKYPSE